MEGILSACGDLGMVLEPVTRRKEVQKREEREKIKYPNSIHLG
jgi:hypothetical protein